MNLQGIRKVHSISSVNFNPNDGVNTTHTVGYNILNNPYDGSGDYLIVQDESTGNIESRWFIIDNARNRAGQYNITLRRDLLADFYNDILSADTYIEKATLLSDNPLILNKEDIQVNQIKTSETQLKDETGCAWIVGYYDNKILQSNPDAYKIEASIDVPFDVAVNSTFTDWEFYTTSAIKGSLINDTITVNTKVFDSSVNTDVGANYIYSHKNSYINKFVKTSSLTNTTNYKQHQDRITPLEPIVNALELAWPRISNAINNQYELPADNSRINRLLSFNNKIVRFLDGEGGYVYYNIEILKSSGAYNGYSTLNNDLFIELRNTISPIAAEQGWLVVQPSAESFKFNFLWNEYSVMASLAEGSSASLKITANANQLQDATYSMFALPYPDEGESFVFDNGIEMTRNLSLSVAMELAIKGGDSVYDLQLLPYCPFRKIIDPDDNTFSISNLIAEQDYAVLGRTGTSPIQPLGYIFFPQKSSFTLNIPLETPIEFTDVKMRNQCDMWRLVSPNYNGQFEFNAMRNGGVTGFNADCTYLPQQPYIHINPHFSLLYGKDFNDARGLLCGGDFSLPREIDAWQQYKLQNKNFQEIFDRQITNMEVTQKYQKIGDIVGAITGTGAGAAAGALAGGSILPGVGTPIGAGIGAVASAAGGIADYFINEKLRTEAINYATDLFNFNLDNIKALPQSISKTTAYTYNNKIYPILEYYTCTDVEKKAVANKIAYNGMTVGMIDKIKNYIDNNWSYGDITSKGYIKGQLIRFEEQDSGRTVIEDFHLVNEIANELNKGFYTR